MGAAASLAADSTLSTEVAKELAGEKWNADIENSVSMNLAADGTISIRDVRCVVPSLFYGDSISLDNAKLHASFRNIEWNDDLNSIFISNAVDGSIPLEQWKSLVPTLFETEKARSVRLETEYRAKLAARAEGNVIINYQMYNEQFPISGNKLTAARIDEDYGLTDVMPGCRIRLSTIDSKARTLYENAHDGRQAPWVKEDPEGTFHELMTDETYYCIVFENAAQYKKDMEELAKNLAASGKVADDSRGPRIEGCSCLFGNPCVDQYICRDWDNRVAVAKKNGWKGF